MWRSVCSSAECGHYTFDGTEYVCRVDGASTRTCSRTKCVTSVLESPTRMIVIPESRLFGMGAGLEMMWERVG